MSRSSGRRAQVEPVAALAAVFAVCAGVALYAGVLPGVLPDDSSGNPAEPALVSVHDEVTTLGVADPGRLPSATAPDGYALNATLSVADERWSVGPDVEGTTNAAERSVSVRTAPGVVRPGTLRVEVWA